MSEKQKQMISDHTPKWFRRMKFWNLVMAVLTPLSGGELVIIFAKIDLPAWVHVVAGVCALLTLILKGVIKDVDGDGLID